MKLYSLIIIDSLQELKLINNTKCFCIINGEIKYFNFKKNTIIDISKDWLQLENYESIFNKFNESESTFHFHKLVKFVDYSNYDKIINEDLKKNIEKHKKYEQPKTTLDFNFRKVKEFNSNFEKLIFTTTFECISKRKFHNDNILLKNIPSVGARHGIELFYNSNGLYNFNPIFKKLSLTKKTIHSLENQYTLVIRPDVYMWRYNTSYCLFDIYYDIGHIIGNLKIIQSFINHQHNIVFRFNDRLLNSELFTQDLLPIISLEV